MEIITSGLNKFNSAIQEEKVEDMAENSITISAGYALETISRTIGNKILDYIFEFIQPKLGSEDWGQRYVGMLTFASIIDGPDANSMMNIISGAYEPIV